MKQATKERDIEVLRKKGIAGRECVQGNAPVKLIIGSSSGSSTSRSSTSSNSSTSSSSSSTSCPQSFIELVGRGASHRRLRGLDRGVRLHFYFGRPPTTAGH